MKRLLHSLTRTGDGAFVIDNRQRIIFWNKAAERILGFSAEEVQGRMCHEVLNGRDEQGRPLCQRYCLVASQAENGAILPSQDVYAQAASGGCWLNVTTFAYPVADKASGRIIVHLFRDATREKSNQRFVERVLAASEEAHGPAVRPPSLSSVADSRLAELTPRQRQVLGLLAQGMGTKEIAAHLTISTSTVRNHAQAILNGLGVHSRLEAIAYAYKQGMPKGLGS
ncbi:MAG: LuxR C-terminal-related transcriptional regulator [Candidatus Promineifilaceae bacterium]|nr:LuxR C-terminal-related transcriptional regulator [Candidatus Promineifilaceae bacterium]